MKLARWPRIGFVIALLILVAGCRGNEISTRANSASPQETPALTSTAKVAVRSETSNTGVAASESPSPKAISSSAVSSVPNDSLDPTRAAGSLNIIVDHSNWDWFNAQPQRTIDSVAKRRIYFAHASIGANIMDGFTALNSLDSTRYPLNQKRVNGDWAGSTRNGTVYEDPRGNPDWPEKIETFETVVKSVWHNPKVDIAMYKFCYIDQAADWKVYRDSMSKLEALYPDTRFIYWTMPLNTNGGTEGTLRAKFNQDLREWVATQNNRALFDLADIEAWGPDRTHSTFQHNGLTNDCLYAGYTTDGGHLNAMGSERVAIGLYSIFGLVKEPAQRN
jgi:hypothetical protein